MSFAAGDDASGDHSAMSAELEAHRRCERLLALMAEAMEMEHAVGQRTANADATPTSLLMPILQDALARLEPMLARAARGSLHHWMSELIDLELRLDAAISQRGWRVLGPDRDDHTG